MNEVFFYAPGAIIIPTNLNSKSISQYYFKKGAHIYYCKEPYIIIKIISKNRIMIKPDIARTR